MTIEKLNKSSKIQRKDKINISPLKEKTKLEKLFENFNGDPSDYKFLINWGKPLGREIW